MAEDGAAAPAPPAPVIVELDPITGVPAEYNEFLPQDSPEYKRWKAAQAEGAAQEGIEKLAVKEGEAGTDAAAAPAAGAAGAAPEAAKPGKGGKSKSKAKAVILIETKERQKNKNVTSVSGMEGFGIKLSEAAKIFGKKFACGASVIKTPSQTEQIEMQGDYLQQIPDLIIKNYAASHGVKQEDIFYM
jgi:density-regulated protein DRP1